MKIAIELIDKNYSNLDLSCAEDGNPGIGGTDYEALLLGELLSRKKDYQVTFYHFTSSNLLPESCNSIIISSFNHALMKANENEEDIYICNTNHGEDWYNALRNIALRVIIWSECYIENKEAREICKTQNVVRVVHVSREEYDYYIDDDIIERSVYVNNMIVPSNYEKRNPIEGLANTVTYLGSLVPQKGFGILAEVWPQIEKAVPDAHLNIIGTGQLYDRNQKLGEYGIAEETFEKKFMKYLTDGNGKVKENVHFLGLLGKEKEEVFRNTKVGVVNPSAKTETFCISGVEMQASAIPVVTKAKHGLLSTVNHKISGCLFKTKRGFAKAVIQLLQQDKMNETYSTNAVEYVKMNFDAEKIIQQWEKVLSDIKQGNTKVEYERPDKNYGNDRKWIKRMGHFLRFNWNMRFLPSLIMIDDALLSLLRTIKRKMLGRG